MPFEKFVDAGRRSYKSKISIRKTGVIGFSSGAVEKFQLQKYKFVTLYYDRQGGLVGIQPTENEEQGASHAINFGEAAKSGSISASVSATKFLEKYGILPKHKNLRLEAEWDKDQGMMLINLEDASDEAVA